MIDADAITVLVIDDHAVVRAALGSILDYQSDMRVVGLAETATAGATLFELLRPDITLVDLSLPDMNGIELIRRLRSRSPEARFLVLTANSGGSEIGCALHAGAQQYFFKNGPVQELLEAIRVLAAAPRGI